MATDCSQAIASRRPAEVLHKHRHIWNRLAESRQRELDEVVRPLQLQKRRELFQLYPGYKSSAATWHTFKDMDSHGELEPPELSTDQDLEVLRHTWGIPMDIDESAERQCSPDAER